ncbi:hypothetical protein Tco_1161026 [Tanacetum coccineum]
MRFFLFRLLKKTSFFNSDIRDDIRNNIANTNVDTDATIIGTKTLVASDVGAGAGESAAATVDTATDFQDSPDDEEDTRSSQEYLNGLEEGYQERALLAKSKRFFKKRSQMFSSAKATDDTICHKCGRKAYEWDEEDVSSDGNDMTEVKVLMALDDDENIIIGKESVRNGELHINTEFLKENKNLRIKLKKLTTITETWLNSSNKVNQCISEQIPSQKKIILGLDQLTEDPSSSGQTDLVFVKSSAEDINVSIPGVERPWLSEAE